MTRVLFLLAVRFRPAEDLPNRVLLLLRFFFPRQYGGRNLKLTSSVVMPSWKEVWALSGSGVYTDTFYCGGPFDHGSFRMRFVVHILALWRGVLRVRRFSPVNTIPLLLSHQRYIILGVNNLVNWRICNPLETCHWSFALPLVPKTHVFVMWVCVQSNLVVKKIIPSTPSFGGEVKLAVPCRRFAACERSLNVTWKSAFRQNSRLLFIAH
jgi:hypothetical protein